MPRFLSIRAFCCMGCLWALGVGETVLTAGDVPPVSEKLLPDTTQGCIAVSNVDNLTEHWEKTQLGHLMADPAMAPFTKDVRRQFEERWSSVHDRLGLTLEDLKGVPGGDAAIALIAPAPGKAALAIVADVSGRLPQARGMLEKVTKTQLQRGATRSELKVEDCPDPVIQFDLPPPEEEKEAGRSELSDGAGPESAKPQPGKPAAESEGARLAFYCLTGNLLAVTDHLAIMKGILERARGRGKGSLADYKPYQVIVQRCRKDYGETAPQIRWYIHPLGYAEAARAATPEDRRRKGKSILEVMRNQGIGAVKGVGGFFDFASEEYEMVHRTAIYAPKPYEKSMKMAVLPNKQDFAPQPWVPRDVATYTTLYFDIQNAFNNFGPMFDELFGQGEQGVWIDVKESLKKDPSGPQVDLDEDLIKHLGQRVSMMTDYQLPITTTSERLLFAIEATDPKAVAAAIEKLMKNDPTAKRREVNGHTVWEMVEDDSMPAPEAPDISFGDVPAVSPAQPAKKKKKLKQGEEEEEKERRLLPHAAITVAEGNLLVSSHFDFLKKIIAPGKKPELLGSDAEYKLIDEEIKNLDPKQKCLRFFSRTDEEYRPTYELVRQNKMPESETMLARLLNGIFGEGKNGAARRQKIDGSRLPEYQVVRRYLGPAGLQATSEEDGWYLRGFTLSKEAE